MSLILNESLVLAKTRSQDLKSVLRLNCWGSGIKDVSLLRELVNVEVIGLSCNEVSTLKDFAHCKKLKELILRKNKIKNISEVAHLQKLPKLTTLWLDENPCVESTYNYRKVVIKALPQLKVLDNKPITREELQEIEELGDEIYEEIRYGSSTSTGSSSGPPSNTASQQKIPNDIQYQQQQQAEEPSYPQANPIDVNESSFFAPTNQLNDSQFNETITSVNQMSINEVNQVNRSMNALQRGQSLDQSNKCLSTQGSISTPNGSMSQAWNNNNNLLPKGGKSRNGNILSAVLCLVKELDYTSCEVVQTALHCRMEETSQ